LPGRRLLADIPFAQEKVESDASLGVTHRWTGTDIGGSVFLVDIPFPQEKAESDASLG